MLSHDSHKSLVWPLLAELTSNPRSPVHASLCATQYLARQL